MLEILKPFMESLESICGKFVCLCLDLIASERSLHNLVGILTQMMLSKFWGGRAENFGQNTENSHYFCGKIGMFSMANLKNLYENFRSCGYLRWHYSDVSRTSVGCFEFIGEIFRVPEFPGLLKTGFCTKFRGILFEVLGTLRKVLRAIRNQFRYLYAKH